MRLEAGKGRRWNWEGLVCDVVRTALGEKTPVVQNDASNHDDGKNTGEQKGGRETSGKKEAGCTMRKAVGIGQKVT